MKTSALSATTAAPLAIEVRMTLAWRARASCRTGARGRPTHAWLANAELHEGLLAPRLRVRQQ
eukprot:5224566-Lingulodinium_polyedra.AAC.1